MLAGTPRPCLHQRDADDVRDDARAARLLIEVLHYAYRGTASVPELECLHAQVPLTTIQRRLLALAEQYDILALRVERWVRDYPPKGRQPKARRR